MSEFKYNITEIAGIVKGELIQKPDPIYGIKDLLIDSRRLIDTANTLFFALSSKKNDGHRFIDELYRKGVRNFVISQTSFNTTAFADANFIRVKDSLSALQSLSAHHRKKFELPVIGITGSNGKTIIKEWLFQMMSDDMNIIRSPKSYNSQIGVPLSVWQINPSHMMGIFEAGISEPDEMDRLQKIIQPTIGIFTNIGQAHSENFIQIHQKVGEKLKLFTKVDTLIYCVDHSQIQETTIRSEILRSIRSFTWSRKQNADLRILSSETNADATEIKAKYLEKQINISIPFTDDASIENAIHCWAALLLLGYDNQLIADRMSRLHPVAMRLELKEGINNCTVINDSYNSDLNSLSIALDFLNQQKQHRQKTLILSDILQSGRNEVDLYTEIASLVEKKEISKFIGIGQSLSKHADKFKGETHFFLSTSEFLRKFSFSSFHNESILLKGARIFEFEQISQALQQKAHETRLEINLNSLIHNLNYFRSKVPQHTGIMAMVKAFSYGSGSYEIANVLQFHHVDYLAVAYADEGVELRKAGINLPVMVMNPDEESFDNIIMHSLEPEIYNFRVLDMLEKAIRKNIIPTNKPVKIHLKLDTGMHRLGFEEKDLDELLNRIQQNKMLYVQSVFSHFAASDRPEHDDFSRSQIERFSVMAEKIQSGANHYVLRHISNSAAISRFPDARFDMVRLGISLYGVSSIEEDKKMLRNVSTLRTNISQIKHVKAGESIGYNRSWIAENDMKIAVVPVGYADGLRRSLSNGKSSLYIEGKAAKIIGDVCMDMCMIDITEISADEGDEVVIFGQERNVCELAKDMNTIPYEVLTGISRRVKRVFYQE